MNVHAKATMSLLFRLQLIVFLFAGVLNAPASGDSLVYPTTFPIDQPLVLPSGIARAEVENNPNFPTYLSYATEVMDNLITYGTDRYGDVQSQLLVSNLDVRTKDNPLAADLAQADLNVRMLRQGRRSPGGSNFFHNQPIYRAMRRASQVTGDSTYTDFVDANFDWALTNLINTDGTLHWGWHRHYDVHTDTQTGHNGSVHEIHGMDAPLWEPMWQQNPAAIENAIEQIWQGHVQDKTTGSINRHNDPGEGSFILSYSSFIEAFAFMSAKVPGTIPGTPAGEPTTWIDRAKLLEDYNWQGRDTTTNLIPDSAQVPQYWNGRTVSTTLPGVYVPGLLRAYEFTGDTYFRDRALTYLDAWGTHAYDASADQFVGALEMDGSPRPLPRVFWHETTATDSTWEPRGYIDMWAPLGETMDHFPDTAQFFAKAFEMFDTTGSLTTPLLTTAERWASTIRKNMPANQTTIDGRVYYQQYSEEWAPYGTYAEHYGRTIDFFLTMYDQTGDDSYLMSARDMAKDGISALWYEGLLRGHAAKPYYEAVDGVGILLEALVELDQHKGNFKKFGDFNNDNNVDLVDYQSILDHWLQQVDPYENGDVTGDGFVSLIDFSRFKNEYFEGPPSALADPSANVPEPSSLMLWLASSSVAIFVMRDAFTKKSRRL